jgi:hypothetical protein
VDEFETKAQVYECGSAGSLHRLADSASWPTHSITSGRPSRQLSGAKLPFTATGVEPQLATELCIRQILSSTVKAILLRAGTEINFGAGRLSPGSSQRHADHYEEEPRTRTGGF